MFMELLELLILAYVTVSNAEEVFRVVWNVPSFMCHRYNLSFNEVRTVWGMAQNTGDEFRGDQVSLLYNPGLWPIITKSGEKINGGVPQEGNLTLHLQELRQNVEDNVPDPHFSGLGVLDFEDWNPIWRQNWNYQTTYKNESIRIEKELHPEWNESQLEAEALRNFETAAREFMLQSLQLVTALRPNALWGYYGFPHCANTYQDHCPSEMLPENDRLQWMFEASGALYPSLYESAQYSTDQHIAFLKGRMDEAVRVADNTTPRPPIYSYYRYNYFDSGEYLSVDDLSNGFKTMRDYGASGVILWGSSNDLNTTDKCKSFNEFLNSHLGPILKDAINSL
ncbi:hyaluronidase Tab y 2.0101-like [Periplaneta americana]|uniref:hyaluronidase Tab y 2.0101-like n=1 Tax=Periplaneta americana TaxID=6978 RepID=UPI0037E7AF8F